MDRDVDGVDLGNGLVLSTKGGYRVAVYRCHCKREQTARCEGYQGGISAEIAEQAGWVRVGDSWECPFCSDNEDKLMAIFDAPQPPAEH